MKCYNCGSSNLRLMWPSKLIRLDIDEDKLIEDSLANIDINKADINYYA